MVWHCLVLLKKWYPVSKARPDEWIFELRKDVRWSDGKPRLLIFSLPSVVS